MPIHDCIWGQLLGGIIGAPKQNQTTFIPAFPTKNNPRNFPYLPLNNYEPSLSTNPSDKFFISFLECMKMATYFRNWHPSFLTLQKIKQNKTRLLSFLHSLQKITSGISHLSLQIIMNLLYQLIHLINFVSHSSNVWK